MCATSDELTEAVQAINEKLTEVKIFSNHANNRTTRRRLYVSAKFICFLRARV